MAARDIGRVMEMAVSFRADFAVVPWRVEGAPYTDGDFSIILIRKGQD
jgi:hypothetical protein